MIEQFLHCCVDTFLSKGSEHFYYHCMRLKVIEKKSSELKQGKCFNSMLVFCSWYKRFDCFYLSSSQRCLPLFQSSSFKRILLITSNILLKLKRQKQMKLQSFIETCVNYMLGQFKWVFFKK